MIRRVDEDGDPRAVHKAELLEVEQQLSRWLLWTVDRVPMKDMSMTQDLVASLLGVRRESITEAAGRLQHGGFIRYRRGHIDVLDRIGLQSRACECYAIVKTEMNRLLPEAQPRREVAAVHA